MNKIHIFSTITALGAGYYAGEFNYQTIMSNFNFGLGTFLGLDGEMVMVNKVGYQMLSDGAIRTIDLKNALTPYAILCNFNPTTKITISKHNLDNYELESLINQQLPSLNYMYAIQFKATFKEIILRTVSIQQEPYPILTEAVKSQNVTVLKNITGIAAGYITPAYLSLLSPTGFHFHFVSDDHKVGGHLFEFTIEKLHQPVELMMAPKVELELPISETFKKFYM